MKRLSLFIAIISLAAPVLTAQTERVKNQPYVDMKLYHFGFHIGFHSQDLLLTHNGIPVNGETWFAEIPSYSPGFSVGVIGDMYMNPYFSLRVTPTIHFGDKSFVFKEKGTGEEFKANVRSNYVTLPVDIKYSALRLNNYRPYLLAGAYGALDIGRKKGNPLLLKGMDYGIEFGIGCDVYLPFFKFCPELKFCFGLADVLEKDRPDLVDRDMVKYSDALSKATSRMVVLTFNFE
ncbi:hypothetical protein Barb6_00009 [Bacteroidales bacterium Barb6]|nr:hypothetical protein Barb6_00009 [Bacteroidales bacterium Barb6]